MSEQIPRRPNRSYQPKRARRTRSRQARWGGIRAELGRAAEVFGLTGFAVVNPVLGPFGESPSTFVATGASAGEIVRFALIVALVPFAALCALGATSRLFGRRARAVTHIVVVAVLVGITAGIVARHLGAGTAARWAAVFVGAAAGGAARWRWEPARLAARYSAPAPVLFLVLFLLASPVTPLVTSSGSQEAEAPGAEASPEGAPPDVVLIVLDEVPMLSFLDASGNVDRGLFPNVARLADTATLHRNHTTVAPGTMLSMPAIVSGQIPRSTVEPAPVADSYPDTLFTLLADSHRIHATEWATGFCPRSICVGAPDEVDDDALDLLHAADIPDSRSPIPRLLAEARSLWWERVWPAAEESQTDYVEVGIDDPHELVRPGLEFLTGLVDDPTDDRPTFDYVHLPVPHGPWQLLPSGRHYEAPYPPAGAEFVGWEDTELSQELALAARSRHQLQLQWADRLLGSIFDRLEDLGRWDDALIVLTADHGVSFTAGAPFRGPLPVNEVEIAWVPLLVKQPGQTDGGVNDTNTWSVDILPTVAEVTGQALTWDVDGQPLTSSPRREGTKPMVAPTADEFPTTLDDRFGAQVVNLESDGLAAARSGFAGFRGLSNGSGGAPGAGDSDPLAAWRHGRHGALLGTGVDDLGVCPPSSATTTARRTPTGWQSWIGGSLGPDAPLPLWHEASLTGSESLDLAMVVDGSVAGWAPSRTDGNGSRVGILLAEPVVEASIDPSSPAISAAEPELFEITSGPDCRLAPIAAR